MQKLYYFFTQSRLDMCFFVETRNALKSVFVSQLKKKQIKTFVIVQQWIWNNVVSPLGDYTNKMFKEGFWYFHTIWCSQLFPKATYCPVIIIHQIKQPFHRTYVKCKIRLEEDVRYKGAMFVHIGKNKSADIAAVSV